jgi:hypothetical protein
MGGPSGSVRRIARPVICDPTGRSGAPRPDRPPSKVAPIALGPSLAMRPSAASELRAAFALAARNKAGIGNGCRGLTR